jgi:hypothetical protein
LVGTGVSALFLWLTVRQVDLADVWRELRDASVGILGLTLVTKGAAFCLSAARTRLLISPTSPITLGTALRSVLLGFIGNNVLPFRLGELLRVAFLARAAPASVEVSLAVVALERVVDTFCLLLILAIAVAISAVEAGSDIRILLMASVVVSALLGAIGVARRPALTTRIVGWATSVLPHRFADAITVRTKRFADGFAALASGRLLVGVLSCSLGIWIFGMASFWVVATALGIDFPWHMPIVVIVFVAFGTMLPSSPGFVGTYHYFATAALVFMGIAEESAAAFATLAHLMAIVPFTLIALPFLMPDLVRALRPKRG